MHEERRDHITRSLAVTANRRGARRIASVTPRGAVCENLVKVAEAGRIGSRRLTPHVDGYDRTAALNGSIAELPGEGRIGKVGGIFDVVEHRPRD